MQRAFSIRPSRPTPCKMIRPPREAAPAISSTITSNAGGLSTALAKTELILLQICEAKVEIEVFWFVISLQASWSLQILILISDDSRFLVCAFILEMLTVSLGLRLCQLGLFDLETQKLLRKIAQKQHPVWILTRAHEPRSLTLSKKTN